MDDHKRNAHRNILIQIFCCILWQKAIVKSNIDKRRAATYHKAGYQERKYSEKQDDDDYVCVKNE